MFLHNLWIKVAKRHCGVSLNYEKFHVMLSDTFFLRQEHFFFAWFMFSTKNDFMMLFEIFCWSLNSLLITIDFRRSEGKSICLRSFDCSTIKCCRFKVVNLILFTLDLSKYLLMLNFYSWNRKLNSRFCNIKVHFFLAFCLHSSDPYQSVRRTRVSWITFISKHYNNSKCLWQTQSNKSVKRYGFLFLFFSLS